jgi:hypothetical protein
VAIGDTGGFDLCLEVTEELLTAVFVAGTSLPPPPDRDVDLGDLQLRVHVTAVTPSALDVLLGEAVFLRGTFTGSVTVLGASIGGSPIAIPAGLSVAVLAGTFAVRATVTVGVLSGVRGVVLTPSSQGSSVVVDENAFFASPPIQLLLAAVYIRAGGGANGEAAYQQRRAMLSGVLREQATVAVVAAAASTPQTLVVREPTGLTFGAVRTSGVGLKIFASSLLPPGNPALASATALRRNALGGPLDHVALVVDNGSILSSVRLALSGALGISSGFGPWFASHPSLVLVPTPVAPPTFPIPSLPAAPGNPPAFTPFLDFAHAFVNAAGMLQLDLRIRAVMWSSLATVTTAATVTAPFVATIVGGVLTFGLGVPTTAASSDVSINPVLYVLAFFLGGPLVVAILAAVDVFAGPFVNGVITGAFTGPIGTLPIGVTLPLTGPFAALTPGPVTGVEPAAPLRVVTLPGPVPITVPIDQAQDVTARFA